MLSQLALEKWAIFMVPMVFGVLTEWDAGKFAAAGQEDFMTIRIQARRAIGNFMDRRRSILSNHNPKRERGFLVIQASLTLRVRI